MANKACTRQTRLDHVHESLHMSKNHRCAPGVHASLLWERSATSSTSPLACMGVTQLSAVPSSFMRVLFAAGIENARRARRQCSTPPAIPPLHTPPQPPLAPPPASPLIHEEVLSISVDIVRSAASLLQTPQSSAAAWRAALQPQPRSSTSNVTLGDAALNDLVANLSYTR